MLKKIGFIFIMILFSFTFITSVDAFGVNSRKVFDNNVDANFNIIDGNEVSANCGGIFTDEALTLISDILNWFRILAPIVLIVMMSVDLASAVMQQDNDALKKATSKIFNRVLATVAVFFIPTFIRIMINLPGVRDALKISDDPLCGTMAVVNFDENQAILK